jgi:hypothetical protein
MRALAQNARAGGLAPKADVEVLVRELEKVEKAIIFPLRYSDSFGIEGDDDVTARAVARYPESLSVFLA